MKRILAAVFGAAALLSACSGNGKSADTAAGTDSLQHPGWSRNAVIYEVNTRQYTPEGTFRAFLPQIPRLQELGVDILWFMPIHPISQDGRKGTLGSYYAVQDYRAVNPEFGTVDDFKAVVDSAHAAGMKVLIDWVPNHTGRDHAWVSEHPEYYKRNEQGEMFGPYDWTDVYQLDYSNDSVRTAMTDILKYWVAEIGIDGFRCDVAGLVPADYWNQARRDLEAAGDREIFMLAEATEPELVERAFDMDYNWPMKDLFSEIAATAGEYTFVGQDGNVRQFPAKHAADIDSLVNVQARQYPAHAYLMNMTSNHDLNSWEGTEFERLGRLAPAFAVLSYTLPGMPVIYTGQETGMARALEFFEKDQAPEWEPRNEYFEFYQNLNNLKHQRPELAAGNYGAPVERIATGNPDVYAFSRTLGDSATFTAVYLSTEGEPATIAIPSGAVDAFSGEVSDGTVTLEPGQYAVYIK